MTEKGHMKMATLGIGVLSQSINQYQAKYIMVVFAID